MSRTVPPSVAAQYSAPGEVFLARCLAMQLRDGTILAMSDHDDELVATLPDLGTVTIAPGAGIMVGDIETTITLDAGNTDFTCPLSQFVGREQVMGRRFNHAAVWVFDLDWSDPAPDPTPIIKGLVADSRVEEAVAIFSIRDLNDYWNVTIGGVLTPRCRADFGDAQCGVVRQEIAAAVTAVTSSMVFTTGLGGAYADDYFRFGDCVFTSGTLLGVWPVEVVAYDGASGEVELLVPLPNAPQVGDQLVLHDGCSRLKDSTDPSIPTCFSHNNVIRFRGFDQVPGSDTFIKIAVPGGG